MQDPDVLIAGAGPAGIATAVALVRLEGLAPGRVLCLDRSRFPRSKPCGGGLTGQAAKALAHLGLQQRVASVPCDEGEVTFGRHSRVATLANPVHVVRREEFDADLVAQAGSLGIRVEQGEALVSFRVDSASQRVEVQTSAGRRLQPRVLVGADGAASLIRKHVQAGAPGTVAPARPHPLRLCRLELPAPPGLPARLARRMLYDFTGMANGLRGYTWVFPVPGGRINVGLMHYPSIDLDGAAIDALLRATLTPLGIELPGPARGWLAWGYDPSTPLAVPHVLTVGDASGIDALTGEGIAVGLEYGPVAARAIRDALARGHYGFEAYRRAVRRAEVGRELALDARIASLLYGRRDPLSWLGMIFADRRMLNLYASRVSGGVVLADCKLELLAILAKHVVLRGRRRRQLAAGFAA